MPTGAFPTWVLREIRALTANAQRKTIRKGARAKRTGEISQGTFDQTATRSEARDVHLPCRFSFPLSFGSILRKRHDDGMKSAEGAPGFEMCLIRYTEARGFRAPQTRKSKLRSLDFYDGKSTAVKEIQNTAASVLETTHRAKITPDNTLVAMSEL